MRNDAVQLARDLFTNANELAHLAEMNILLQNCDASRFFLPCI